MMQYTTRLLATFSLVVIAIFSSVKPAKSEIPAWLLEKLQNIKPQPESMNPIIIPGWNKQQAEVLAGTFITGQVQSVVGVPAEQAMSGIGEYEGNKSPLIVAKGRMKGPISLGPNQLNDPEVTMTFDNNGNLLKRQFVLPIPKKVIFIDPRKPILQQFEE
jgi:hypothetical protein